MGRIPGRNRKKHLGYKDPFQQQAARFEKIKGKINNPPKNPHEQEISRKSKRLFGDEDDKTHPRPLKKKWDQRYDKAKRKSELLDTANFVSQDIGSYPRSGRPFKPIPTLAQTPNESVHAFFKRVSNVTKMVIEESKFQDKHDVEVERDESGEVVSYKMNAKVVASKERKRFKRKERALKLKLRKYKKRNENFDSDDESSEKKLFTVDQIKFGEVVSAPPTLHTEKLEELRLKLQRQNEKNLLGQSKVTLQNENLLGQSKVRLQKLDQEREKAVLLYRKLKAAKRDSTTP